MTSGPLLDELQRALDSRQRSARTARAYVHWVREFLQFLEASGAPLSQAGADAFVEEVVRERGVSASTRRQALTALSFFFRHVLADPLRSTANPKASASSDADLERPLTPDDSQLVFAQLDGPHWLIGALLVSSGLGLIEACRLRVRDIDVETLQLTVRQPGAQDRRSLAPPVVAEPLRVQLARCRETYEADTDHGGGHVLLPPESQHDSALPATRAWEWQWLFPGARTYADPATGLRYRHHQHENGVQRAIRNAGRQAKLQRRVTCQALRATFTARAHGAGVGSACIQYLLGQDKRAHEAEALRALASLHRGWTL